METLWEQLESIKQRQNLMFEKLDKWNKEHEVIEVLQHGLKFVGEKFKLLPQAKTSLLNILEEAESCLCRVSESPLQTRATTMSPLVHSLVKLELTRHQDEELRLAVVTCISEIMRTIAPKVPYNDDILKEVLQLIVESLHGLHGVKAPTFGKRAKILEIMARTRSFVLMLDLQCDKLILQMFHCFIAIIRKCHPDKVKIDMLDILSMILDEKDDVCKQMRYDLINIWRRKMHISAIAFDLLRSLVELKIERFREQLTTKELISWGLQVLPSLQVRNNLDVDKEVSMLITPITLLMASKKDNDIHLDKEEIMESITTSEGKSELFIGDVQIFIDKIGEEEKFFDEFTYVHNIAPVEFHEESMLSSSGSAKLVA
ncbi:hypothetical protein SUGI_0591330 [Cryptomeria japonica]|nr:hypothetical protein SUGI_0591330 [Cryptomeria japonica]